MKILIQPFSEMALGDLLKETLKRRYGDFDSSRRRLRAGPYGKCGLGCDLNAGGVPHEEHGFE